MADNLSSEEIHRIQQALGIVQVPVTLPGGYSGERVCVWMNPPGNRQLIRIDSKSNLIQRQEQFTMMAHLHERGVPCQEPLKFAHDDLSCYGLFTFIEGLRADEVLPHGPTELVRSIGEAAGQALKQIHDETQRTYLGNERAHREAKFQRVWRTFSQVPNTSIALEGPKRYVEHNLHLINSRPVTFRHGDFHPGSLIVSKGGLEGVIDFNRADWGDPWDDFYKLAFFGAPLSVEFTNALISSYFQGNPPDEFWPIYNLFVAATLPADLNWCIGKFANELPKAEARVSSILGSHDFAEGGPPSWWT